MTIGLCVITVMVGVLIANALRPSTNNIHSQELQAHPRQQESSPSNPSRPSAEVYAQQLTVTDLPDSDPIAAAIRSDTAIPRHITGLGLITKGDIDVNGVQDALVDVTTCGASCGHEIAVVVGEPGGQFRVLHSPDSSQNFFEPEYQGSGAAKTILTAATIASNGDIILEGYGFKVQGVQDYATRVKATFRLMEDGRIISR